MMNNSTTKDEAREAAYLQNEMQGDKLREFGYAMFNAGYEFAKSEQQEPEPKLTRERLSKMKPAEIAKLDWAEVKRVLKGE